MRGRREREGRRGERRDKKGGRRDNDRKDGRSKTKWRK